MFRFIKESDGSMVEISQKIFFREKKAVKTYRKFSALDTYLHYYYGEQEKINRFIDLWRGMTTVMVAILFLSHGADNWVAEGRKKTKRVKSHCRPWRMMCYEVYRE